MTKVVYYLTPKNENPVKDFLESLSKKQKSKAFRIFTLLSTYGLSSVIPHVKKLSGTPFWEIRILGSDNIRIMYVTVKHDQILVLHGFIKKQQKTPEREMRLASLRYKQWLDK